MKAIVCLLASLALGQDTSTLSAPYTIDTATRTFRDRFGRGRIFHGTNVVVKLPPYLPTEDGFNYRTSMTDEDMQQMKAWGIKIVRLGVMWEAVERQPGVYDMEYLDQVEELINRFGQYDIAVIVDNHQDLFSRNLCGEGVPYFYTDMLKLEHRCPLTPLARGFHLAGECISLESYGFEVDDKGLPLVSQCQEQDFMVMYTAPEVASAFAGLYANEAGLLDKMMDFWSVVSERFAANQYVIGYDILNEPWTANMYHEQSLFTHPESFDRDVLYPLEQRASQTVRAKDTEHFIFFEPAQFPDTLPFFGGYTLPLGYPATPGGEEYLDKQVLNDHTYCCQADPKVCATGEPPLDTREFCRTFHQQKVHQRYEDAKNFSVPLMFTEFGACFDSLECYYEITNSVDAFDTALASWAYWMYKGFGDFTTTGGDLEGMYTNNGVPQTLKVKALTRTYGTAYQGTPTAMYFSAEDGSFMTTFTVNGTVQNYTEIYMNQPVWYPDGFKWVFSSARNGREFDGTKMTTSDDGHYLSFYFFDVRDFDGKDCNIMITPTKNESDMKGHIDGKDGNWTMDYEFIDEGYTGKCPIKVKYHHVPYYMEVMLFHRNGTKLNTFGKTYGSNGYKGNCADLIDAKISLWHKTETWNTTSFEVASLPLRAMNGMSLTIDVNKVHHVGEETADIGNFSSTGREYEEMI